MKRFLSTIFILLITASCLHATSGTLTIYSYVAEGSVVFSVTQSSEVSVNFLSVAEVQPDGPGHIIGKWSVTAERRVSSESYTVTYSYDLLRNVEKPNAKYFAYEILEYEGETAVAKSTGSTTALTLGTGTTTTTRNIAFRLTPQGAIDAAKQPANYYTDTITITFSSN